MEPSWSALAFGPACLRASPGCFRSPRASQLFPPPNAARLVHSSRALGFLISSPRNLTIPRHSEHPWPAAPSLPRPIAEGSAWSIVHSSRLASNYALKPGESRRHGNPVPPALAGPCHPLNDLDAKGFCALSVNAGSLALEPEPGPGASSPRGPENGPGVPCLPAFQ